MTFRWVIAGSRLRYRVIRPAYPIGCDLNVMISYYYKSAFLFSHFAVCRLRWLFSSTLNP